MKKIVSIILALACLFSMAYAESEKTELMTFGGIPVYLEDVQEYAKLLYDNGASDSEDNLLAGLEYALRFDAGRKLLIPDAAAYLGEEAYSSVAAEAGAYYDESVQEYVSLMAPEGATEDDLAALALEAPEAFGITRDEYIASSADQSAYQALIASIDVTVTDEEVKAMFDEEVAYEMQVITGAAMYEYYTNYFGYEFFFMPEGYRSVLHILVDADKDLLSAYENAADETAKAEAAAAVVASISETIDEIYAQYNDGVAFTDLIAKYNIDPGMQNEETLQTGYLVHPDSIMWVPEFTAGAFSEKMVKPGDVSDPVVTSYGVHILYYMNDVPAGPVELTAETMEYLRSYLASGKQAEGLDAMLKAFEATYTDAYAQYIGAENFLQK